MEIKILKGDDWVGLYMDDNLVIEGHSLDAGDVIEKITGVAPVEVYVEEESTWDSWGSRAPRKFPNESLDSGPTVEGGL